MQSQMRLPANGDLPHCENKSRKVPDTENTGTSSLQMKAIPSLVSREGKAARKRKKGARDICVSKKMRRWATSGFVGELG